MSFSPSEQEQDRARPEPKESSAKNTRKHHVDQQQRKEAPASSTNKIMTRQCSLLSSELDDINIDTSTPSTRAGTSTLSSSLAERALLEPSTMLSLLEGLHDDTLQLPERGAVGEARSSSCEEDDPVFLRCAVRSAEEVGTSAFSVQPKEGGDFSSASAHPRFASSAGLRERAVSASSSPRVATTARPESSGSRANCVATLIWWLISAPTVQNLLISEGRCTGWNACYNVSGDRSIWAFLTCRRRRVVQELAPVTPSVVGLTSIPASASSSPSRINPAGGCAFGQPNRVEDPSSKPGARRLRAFLSGAPVGGAASVCAGEASPGRVLLGKFCIVSKLLQDHVFNSALEACASPEEVRALPRPPQTQTRICCRRRSTPTGEWSVKNWSFMRIMVSPLWSLFQGHLEVWHEDFEEEGERRQKKCLVFKFTLGFGLRSRQVIATLLRATLRFPYVDVGAEIDDPKAHGEDRDRPASTAPVSVPTTDEHLSNSPGRPSVEDLEDGIHSRDWVENVGDRVIDRLMGEYKISALFRHSPRSSRDGPLELPPGEVRLLLRSAAITVLFSSTVLESGNVRDESVSFETGAGRHVIFNGR